MRTLDDWLQHWLTLPPREIVLGLDRVGAVWRALGAPPIARRVISVAGTNGKGSTVAFLEAMLSAGGYRVGAFTSPHVLRYHERIRVAGCDVNDADLIHAFTRIEAARGSIVLSYFEAGALAAWLIFAAAELDVAVLEVGLGGRLDAVNLIAPDVAMISSIDLDHQGLLGTTRAAIAIEKAGIARAGRPMVVGDLDPPASLVAELARIGARQLQAGRDFRWQIDRGGSTWQYLSERDCLRLPLPQLRAPVQIGNAALAITALRCLGSGLPLTPAQFAAGVATATAPGRLQVLARAPELIVDVAHNPQAARALAEYLSAQPKPTVAVFGLLDDKDLAGVVTPLHAYISHWQVLGLEADSPRGQSAETTLARLRAALPTVAASPQTSAAQALAAARSMLPPTARILGFGSFHVVAAILRAEAEAGR